MPPAPSLEHGLPFSSCVGDLNNDGRPDLALGFLYYGSGYCTDTKIASCLGNGDGTFACGAGSLVSNSCNLSNVVMPGLLAVGELNGDGKLDATLVGYVVLGNGDGSFGFPAATGTSPYAATIGDLNNDGKNDIVVVEGNDVTVVMNAWTGGCFIATSAFGTSLEGKIDVLRSFRDTFLLTNPIGRGFVESYYRHSPSVAAYLSDHQWIRAAVRILLLPVIGALSLLG